MFPMVMGVLVGLAVLILIVLFLIAFGFHRRRKQAAFARRNALSDQADTNSSNISKPTLQSPMMHPSTGNGSYVYLRQQPQKFEVGSGGSDSGGVASTYMSHGAFAAAGLVDGCTWPSGLQPPPTGSNYFDDGLQPVAFPSLGGQHGSEEYIQLPVRYIYICGIS